jgi:hypothetical protein
VADAAECPPADAGPALDLLDTVVRLPSAHQHDRGAILVPQFLAITKPNANCEIARLGGFEGTVLAAMVEVARTSLAAVLAGTGDELPGRVEPHGLAAQNTSG